jgi:mediator of RNA polymerase II transcription subunit 12
VFRKLDSINYKSPVRIEDLSYECMEIISNATQLISALLQWSCSCYRTGSHRIYLATRLLRRWSHLGADVYEGVISYLQSMTWADSGDMNILLRIVAELVRSKHLSAGRYLQWLIATGSLGRDIDLSSVSLTSQTCIGCANSEQPRSWTVRLITEFPLAGLSDQVRNLRSTLLRGTAHAADLEQQALNFAKQTISRAAPTLFGLNMISPTHLEVKLEGLSSTVKLEVGIWLRQQVAQHAEVNEQ